MKRWGSRLGEIEKLDPLKDHERIVYLDCCYEFPFDFTRSLELALFRTYCVPSISGLLARTGEFTGCPQKRYDDTDILISEMMEWGYSSTRGSRALERMNRIHAHFDISNADYLYVLSTFIYEPIRWMERFGWRPMCQKEKLALFYFWRSIGGKMGMRNIPRTFAAFEKFNRDYEAKYFKYAESNRLIGDKTRTMFASWFPAFLRPAINRAIPALLDRPTNTAFGFPLGPAWLSWLLEKTVKARARLLWLVPVRKRPRLRTMTAYPSYPDGYTIERVGPDYLDKHI